jgi:tyrosyl-tRNA synthetase
MVSPKQQLELLKARTAEVIPEEELLKKLERSQRTGEPLRVKLGIDPSAPHLTLGHAVVLRKLRDFQELGHTAVLIVGDFTRRVGDPSGRKTTRPLMSEEEIQKFMKTYKEQAFKILDPAYTEIRYNSEWLGKLDLEGIIHLTSKYTLARMLEREDFSTRFRDNLPISILELLYPLLQAYDSVAVQADVELGGEDQRFNLLIGRDIQREYGGEPQVIMTMPLLIGTDGAAAMSQSRGNYIGISEPPGEIYGKVMSLPDELMEQYYTLLTDIPWEEVKGLHPKACKMKLARALVSAFYNEEAARRAEEEFERVFSRGERPKDVPKVMISRSELKPDGTIRIVDLLEASGLVKSRSEARRLIEQGAVELDGTKIDSVDADVRLKDSMLLRVGKHRFAEFSIEGAEQE